MPERSVHGRMYSKKGTRHHRTKFSNRGWWNLQAIPTLSQPTRMRRYLKRRLVLILGKTRLQWLRQWREFLIFLKTYWMMTKGQSLRLRLSQAIVFVRLQLFWTGLLPLFTGSNNQRYGV